MKLFREFLKLHLNHNNKSRGDFHEQKAKQKIFSLFSYI